MENDKLPQGEVVTTVFHRCCFLSSKKGENDGLKTEMLDPFHI